MHNQLDFNINEEVTFNKPIHSFFTNSRKNEKYFSETAPVGKQNPEIGLDFIEEKKEERKEARNCMDIYIQIVKHLLGETFEEHFFKVKALIKNQNFLLNNIKYRILKSEGKKYFFKIK